MIQKSIYFKHIIEEWRCSLVNEYYKKNIDFVVLFCFIFIIRSEGTANQGGLEACSAQKIFQF